VIKMFSMFNTATLFNQNLSNWNVSAVSSSNYFDNHADAWQEEFKPIFPILS